MAKIITGKVVSIKMQNTIIIEVTRRTPHPLYKKLIKRSNRFKADTGGLHANLGDTVQIVETRPISKDKHFKLIQVKEVEKKK